MIRHPRDHHPPLSSLWCWHSAIIFPLLDMVPAGWSQSCQSRYQVGALSSKSWLHLTSQHSCIGDVPKPGTAQSPTPWSRGTSDRHGTNKIGPWGSAFLGSNIHDLQEAGCPVLASSLSSGSWHAGCARYGVHDLPFTDVVSLFILVAGKGARGDPGYGCANSTTPAVKQAWHRVGVELQTSIPLPPSPSLSLSANMI